MAPPVAPPATPSGGSGSGSILSTLGIKFPWLNPKKEKETSLRFKVEKDWSRYAIKARNTPPFPNPPLARRTMPPAPQQQQGDA